MPFPVHFEGSPIWVDSLWYFHQVHTVSPSLLSVALACKGSKSPKIMGFFTLPKKGHPLMECQPHGCLIGWFFLPNKDKLLLKSNQLMQHPGVYAFEGVCVVLPKHQKRVFGWIVSFQVASFWYCTQRISERLTLLGTFPILFKHLRMRIRMAEWRNWKVFERYAFVFVYASPTSERSRRSIRIPVSKWTEVGYAQAVAIFTHDKQATENSKEVGKWNLTP